MTATGNPSLAASGSIYYKRLLTGPVLAIVAVIVMLGLRFSLVISKYSINVFFYDQWEYLTPFFGHSPTLSELFFLEPARGPIREGLGLFVDKFLYPLTHWNSRIDSFMVGGSIFAAMLLALLLKRKLYGALSYSDVAIPIIFLTLQQYEALVGTPNPGYSSLPLLMMMLYCLALLGRNRLLRYALVLALNFLLIYTGWGFFMGVVTVGVFLLECYWSWRGMTSVPLVTAVMGLVLAAGSLASFFIHYTFFSGVECFEIPHRHLLHYPQFTALMFSGFVVPRPIQVSLRMTVLGVAILTFVAAVLRQHLLRLSKDPHGQADLVGAVLLSYSLLFAANASIGRLCQGLQMAYSSRYVTLLIPAFLASYFFLLSSSWQGQRNLVLTLWILLLLPATVRKPWDEVRWYSSGKRNWAECYVRTENIHYCDQSANFAVHTPFEEIGLQQKLDYLKQHQLNLFYEPHSR
jgi:hypothetical protein